MEEDRTLACAMVALFFLLGGFEIEGQKTSFGHVFSLLNAGQARPQNMIRCILFFLGGSESEISPLGPCLIAWKHGNIGVTTDR